MGPKHQRALFCIAERVMTSKRKHVQTIRQLAGTEEYYLLIIREIDRLEGQLCKTRSLQAQATLTLLEWLTTLHYFNWHCAYCQERPFQVMSHIISLPQGGGTTVENCVPACYRCGRSGRNKKTNTLVIGNLMQLKTKMQAIKEQAQLTMKQLNLSLLPDKYAVCQFHPDKHIPYWALLGDFVSLTRTPEELSIVCQEDNVPGDIEAERGWRCVQVRGAFDFSIAGVNASLAIPLAEAYISVLAIATYATDYLLVKEENVERALQVLEQAGHIIER